MIMGHIRSRFFISEPQILEEVIQLIERLPRFYAALTVTTNNGGV